MEQVYQKINGLKDVITTYVAEECPVMSGIFTELEKAVQEMAAKILDNKFIEENY
ncbi:MAG TPA: hypothetical protein VL098_12080 [Flavipsychrobacter sp.]|nr:hypothetical protein [Flavipsychrobacter sp.]